MAATPPPSQIDSTLPSGPTALARSEALEAYRVLDSAAEGAFDDLTQLAGVICGAPISLISLLDEPSKRQWFLSKTGIERKQTPIEQSFCAHAVDKPGHVMVIEDATLDDRFRENPLVTASPHIRAYAGAPLISPEGIPLGTICAIDTVPRKFTAEQQLALSTLAKQVIAQLELRRRVGVLELTRRRLQSLNEQLDQFAYIVSHDLKAPIRHQASFAQLMLEDYADRLDDDQRSYLQRIIEAGDLAQQIIVDLNEYVHTVQTAFGTRHELSLPRVIEQVIELAEPPAHVHIDVDYHGVELVESNATALRHILVNLLSNAIKFNDGDRGRIAIDAARDENDIVIRVSDNGPGIAASDQQRIFNLFARGQGASNVPGRGVGLAIAAKLTQNLGGAIAVESTVGEGATFVVRIPEI